VAPNATKLEAQQKPKKCVRVDEVWVVMHEMNQFVETKHMSRPIRFVALE